MLRLHVVPPRNLGHVNPRHHALRNDPRLGCRRPRPATLSRSNNVHPLHDVTTSSHRHMFEYITIIHRQAHSSSGAYITAQKISEMWEGFGAYHKIGEDRSERLDITPAQHRVMVTIRPRYACRCCSDGVTQAPAPVHVVPGGLPTEALIADVLINKYCDHLPLYRQSKIFARQGIAISRATLANWVGRGIAALMPITNRMRTDDAPGAGCGRQPPRPKASCRCAAAWPPVCRWRYRRHGSAESSAHWSNFNNPPNAIEGSGFHQRRDLVVRTQRKSPVKGPPMPWISAISDRNHPSESIH